MIAKAITLIFRGGGSTVIVLHARVVFLRLHFARHGSDSEEELWTETASLASSSAIVASVASGEDRGCLACSPCSSSSVARSETERTSVVALG